MNPFVNDFSGIDDLSDDHSAINPFEELEDYSASSDNGFDEGSVFGNSAETTSDSQDSDSLSGNSMSLNFNFGPVQAPVTQFDDDPQSLLINYNEKFKHSEPCLFRDEIIAQILSVLISKSKPNCLLFGPAGCGKTRIAEDLARMLANDDPCIPECLRGSTVYELPLSLLVSGSAVVGDLEKKTLNVINFLKDPENKAICFIDEIHLLYSNDTSYTKIAQFIKPALARGEVRFIGATTTQEITRLNSDPAFNRRFSRLIVNELTKEQTLTILNKSIPSFIKHYANPTVPSIYIPEWLLPDIVRLADQFPYAGNHRPDNAITLLDRTLGDMLIARHLEVKEGRVAPGQPVTVNTNAIQTTAMRLMTGNSRKKTFDDARLKKELKNIIGQNSVIERITEIIKQYQSPYFSHNKPLTLLFAGFSGTGKTETAKILAHDLMDMKPIILNMTEYDSSSSINRIIGSPAGYVGFDSDAEYPFDVLETNPYQLILLDEFEKCDPAVQKLFMSAFDEGMLKRSNGKTIDFSKSIIIATTNASHSNSSTGKMGFSVGTESSRKEDLLTSLSDSFPIELLNRFEDILEFNPLTKDDYVNILKSVYIREISRIKSEFSSLAIQQLPGFLSDEKASEIADQTYVKQSGARPANAAVRKFIESILPETEY